MCIRDRLSAILAAQLALGVLNIVWVLPLLNATFHNLGGAALLLALIAVNYRAQIARRALLAH